MTIEFDENGMIKLPFQKTEPLEKQLTRLRKAAMEVIKKEELPVPSQIRFRNNSKRGNKHARGRCIKSRADNKYRILVALFKAKFVPHPEGEYRNRRTGQRLKRINPELCSFEELRKTLAHEIAHLKFWEHTQQHRSYTHHIDEQLKEVLKCESC